MNYFKFIILQYDSSSIILITRYLAKTINRVNSRILCNFGIRYR